MAHQIEEYPLISAQDADTAIVAANGRSGALDSSIITVQVVYTGLDASDGVLKLQGSNDDSNWDDLSGASATLDKTETSASIKITDVGHKFVAAVWTPNSVSAGTITSVNLVGK